MSAVVVSYATCWSCMNGIHFDPSRWHAWDSEDDESRADDADQGGNRCACPCADEPAPT